MTTKHTKQAIRPATADDVGKNVYCTDDAPDTWKPGPEDFEEESNLEELLKVKDGRFLGLSLDGSESAYFWDHAYIMDEVPMTYQDLVQASGLKPGDWVKITRAAKDYELGWDNVWCDAMDKYIGSVVEVRLAGIDNDKGLYLLGAGNFRYPVFVLEKVTTRPATDADIHQEVNYDFMGPGKFILEGVFTAKRDPGRTRAVVSKVGNCGLEFAMLADLTVTLPGAQEDQPEPATESAPEPVKPDWLPEGWRVMGPDEVLQAGDKVQGNYYPQEPNSHWVPVLESISVGKTCRKAFSGDVCITQRPLPTPGQPGWLPEGWRVLGPDEVIQEGDKVQKNFHPATPTEWAEADLSIGKSVQNSMHPKDIWITQRPKA